MKNFEKRRFMLIVLIFLFLTIISFWLDSRVAVLVANARTGLLNEFFLNFGSALTVFIFVVILTAVFFQQKKKESILPLWFAAGMSVVVSFLLKVIVQRPRPFQLGLVHILGVADPSYAIWHFSYPSFHTMAMFAMVPFLNKEFPRFKYVWIAFAVLIGFSRLYLGVHFLSDVMAGGLIGYIMGTLIVESEKESRFWERMYNKIFRKN